MDFYMTFWIAAIIILTIAEILSINLTTIWYVVSAIVALILSFFVDNFIIQFGVFAVLGTILLITTKPLLTRLLKVDEVSSEHDDEEILKKIELRNEAKKNKDFVTADAIRDELLEQGVRLVDTREGTTYELI